MKSKIKTHTKGEFSRVEGWLVEIGLISVSVAVVLGGEGDGISMCWRLASVE